MTSKATTKRIVALASRSWHAAKRWASKPVKYCVWAIWRAATTSSSATGITKGDLLEGISRKGNIATTETLLIRGKSRTIRRIQSIHYLDRKDPEMQVHIL